jgi:hypothetical protein
MATLEPIHDGLRAVLSEPWLLAGWAAAALVCAAIGWYDLRRNNPEIPPLMRIVWLFTIVYSGPLGLALYWVTGRKQIARDSLWRRAGRSVAHCYSGCGAGEIVGLVLTVGVLAAATWTVALTTFALAYLFGLALTVGPLMEEGVGFRQAMKDGIASETASITVMEVTAIGVDLWLAGAAGIGDALFWGSMVLSLTAGLIAAYPVNALLIAFGVKEGMHDPREMAEHAG